MKILVTGHKGFIGSNMINALAKHHEVVGYEWGYPTPNVKGMDWVIHLGAISSTVEQDVNKIINQNLTFSIDLFENCIKHGVKFQWASSASVYGYSLTFNESDTPQPLNHYARSKYLLEEYIKTRAADITWQGFRYFNVYGPNESHKGKQASPFTQFEQQAKTTGVIKLFHNSDQYKRDFVPVEMVVDYHQRFFNVQESGIWNLGTGSIKSFEDVARQIAAKYNAEIQYIDMPDVLKTSYQTYTRADVTKLNKTLAL